ncbi:MAG: biotin--[acetyl-CoA-carboxylase] ligase [Saonia sp.]
MQIIKLDATESTNLYLKKLMLSTALKDCTVVVAKAQLNGRGQRGTKWDSETGKNLTFSVLKRFDSLDVGNRFFLNICVSLAIYDSLKQLQIPDISVKWPNDILSGHSKICGILIENILSGKNIQASIIGIGLNVNQLKFTDLPKVSSLKLLLGRTLNLDELLLSIIDNLKKYSSTFDQKSRKHLTDSYEKLLFRRDKPSTFKNLKNEMFMGLIRGISADGKLVVSLEDNTRHEFDLKEIKLLY